MTEKKFENQCGCGCNEEHLHHECDNDCQCNHDYDGEYKKIHLSLDNGEEMDCFVLGIFEVEDKEYIALVPEENERVFLYRYAEEDNNPILTNIEDDEEFEIVVETFRELFG